MSAWSTKELKDLVKALLSIQKEQELLHFLRDLCTLEELTEMATRWRIAQLLYEGKLSYRQVAQKTKVSTTTVTRIAAWLWHGEGGYAAALERGKKRE